MYNALRLGKKIFTVSVVVTTIAWSIGLAMFLLPLTANAAAPLAGDLIKASLPSVYYYGADGKRYVFPNEKTYRTWYADFSSVKTITDAELAAIALGGNVTYKPGVKMVKITTDPKVYAVGANGALRWVKTEALATELYGATWNTMIEDVPDAFFVNYTIGADINAAADFNKAAQTAAATDIGVDKGIGAGGTIGTTAGGLTVALASDTPAAASIVCADTSSITKGAQIAIPMTKLNFTASSAGAVKVTSLKLKRGGISADTDMSIVYLYDGDTQLAEHQSISKNYITFTNANGLFEVPASGSKTITVKMDLSNSTSSASCSAKTINIGLVAAADVTSNASSVAGTFPVTGNTMTGAAVSDLGVLGFSAYTTFPATIDPGVTDRELWRFTLTASNQDVELRYLKLTVVGTIAVADLANLKLTASGVQLGATQQLSSDKEVTFDLRSSPLVLTTGQTKTVILTGDVVGGTSRAFKFTVQKRAYAEARDRNYDVMIKLDSGNDGVEDSFTLIEPETGNGTDINTGKLVMSVATDSPTGNIADYATNVTLAKFGFQAIGEDIKVLDLDVDCDSNGDDDKLDNLKLLLDGVQVGTTITDTTACDADSTSTFTFGNTFIVPGGTTKYLTAVADTTDSTMAADDTVWLIIAADTTGAQGRTSLSSIAVTSQTSRTLTVKSGTVTVAKDSAFADRSSTAPSGAANAAEVKIGSFVIEAGSGEAVDVTQIVLYDGEAVLGSTWQNLKIKHNETQIGSTLGSLNSTAGTYTFTASPALRITAGAQYRVEVFADIKSGANIGLVSPVVKVDSITATGVNTSSSASCGSSATPYCYGSDRVSLQAGYVASNGNLTVLVDADAPVAQQLVMGATEQVIGKFKLEADNVENINVTQLVISDKVSSAATGTFKNVKLYVGSEQLGGTLASFSVTSASSTYANAIFAGLNLTVPKNGSKVVTVKADLTTYDAAPDMVASTHTVNMLSQYSGTSESVTATGLASGASITGASLDYEDPKGTSRETTGRVPHSATANRLSVYRTKLTVAWASDTPSGAAVGSSAQTITKFIVSNASNVGDYPAHITRLNLTLSSGLPSATVGISNTAARTLKIYKDSILSTNQVATTNYCSGVLSPTNCRFITSTMTALKDADNNTINSVEIASGASKTFIATLDTSDARTSTYDKLSVYLDSGDLLWSDGPNFDSRTLGDAAGEYADGLPLPGKTFSY